MLDNEAGCVAMGMCRGGCLVAKVKGAARRLQAEAGVLPTPRAGPPASRFFLLQLPLFPSLLQTIQDHQLKSSLFARLYAVILLWVLAIPIVAESNRRF